MPQWRKLHIKTVESLDLNDMPDDFTRLTWIMLPLVLCREGRGLLNTAWIKSKVYPLRMDVTNDMITKAMKRYQELGMIESYQVCTRKYFQVVNWHKYQGNTSREADSPYPEPSNEDIPNESKDSQELVKSKSGVGKTVSEVYPSASVSLSKSSKGGVGGKSHPDIYSEMIAYWAKCHPDKPQPRPDNKTLKSKVKTRMKSQHFQANWRDAMERAARSKFLAGGSFFDFGWFVANDDNYEKCLNGKYDDSKAGANGSGPEVDEILNDIKLYSPREQPKYSGRKAKVFKLAGGSHALRGMSVYDARRALQLAAAEVPG